MTVANNNGWTPLNSAVYHGHIEVVELLLKKDADLNIANNDGWTPLHIAANNGHTEVVKLLLKKGAEMTIASNDGWTPLNMAADNGYVKVVKLLLEKGANLNIVNNDGWTPLNIVVDNSYIEVIKLLLKKGADLTVASNNGWTPLFSAARWGHTEVVQLLLEKGADLNVANNDGWTPLHSAASNGHIACLRLLLEGDARTQHPDPNVKTDMNTTALHAAVYQCNVPVIKLLLEHGADPHLLDGFGRSCLDWVCNYKPMADCFGKDMDEYHPTDESVSYEIIRQSVNRLVSIASQQDFDYHILGHCLILIGDEAAACTAFEQQITSKPADGEPAHRAICNMCQDNEGILGSRFVCRMCPDVDFCESCMAIYRHEPAFKVCRNHDFLQIPGSTWAERSTEIITDNGETRPEWLLALQKSYTACPTSNDNGCFVNDTQSS